MDTTVKFKDMIRNYKIMRVITFEQEGNRHEKVAVLLRFEKETRSKNNNNNFLKERKYTITYSSYLYNSVLFTPQYFFVMIISALVN